MTVDGVSSGTGGVPPTAAGAPIGPSGSAGPKPRAQAARANSPDPPRPDPPVHTRAHFFFDEETKRTAIVIVDNESGKVVRQIPPEEILQLARMYARGLGLVFETQG